MSLLLITNPPVPLVTSTDLTTLVTRSNANMHGHGLSIPIFTLTNWDATTTRPEIAAGSIIEVGGSFYQADVDTALTDDGGISDGTVHIKLVPGAGSPDPLTVTPTLTNDALPAWDANKAGWYTGANKYLPFEMTKAAAVYTIKGEYIDQNSNIKKTITGFYDLNVDNNISVTNDLSVTNDTYTNTVKSTTTNQGVAIEAEDGVGLLRKRVIPVGAWDMRNVRNITVLHGVPDFTKIRNIWVIIFPDSAGGNLLPLTSTAFTGTVNGSVLDINSTQIKLQSFASGTFGTSSYDSVSINRGYIHIEYIV